ncbi:hypothetical protein RFI_00304 [Reticulomyxa filosa]|uniref:Uncharacterized protein n=1 Tax=Reticulomyxa filosa TaxID=46433 RepID=X6PF73_RETFI|nr:hypothetical protein RFI_00304 [Reticulomyxa filosa]|eukprot:ETO36758.1 hypothetical protein RFI_00304 [Reticulomyxa filosa]
MFFCKIMQPKEVKLLNINNIKSILKDKVLTKINESNNCNSSHIQSFKKLPKSVTIDKKEYLLFIDYSKNKINIFNLNRVQFITIGYNLIVLLKSENMQDMNEWKQNAIILLKIKKSVKNDKTTILTICSYAIVHTYKSMISLIV